MLLLLPRVLLTKPLFFQYAPDKHNLLSDIKSISLSTLSDQLVVLHHEAGRDSVLNLRTVIGSMAKPQLRRTRSFSQMGEGGKNAISKMTEQAPAVRERALSISAAPDVTPAVVAVVSNQADDASERYSELVVCILSAFREQKLPVPLINFSNEIQVNVSKKSGERRLVTIRCVVDKNQLNSTWVKGKDSHTVTSLGGLKE